MVRGAAQRGGGGGRETQGVGVRGVAAGGLASSRPGAWGAGQRSSPAGQFAPFHPQREQGGRRYPSGRAGQVPGEAEGARWKLPPLSSQVYGSAILLLLDEQSVRPDARGGQGPRGASAVSQGWGQAPNLRIPLWGLWAVYRASGWASTHITELSGHLGPQTKSSLPLLSHPELGPT